MGERCSRNDRREKKNRVVVRAASHNQSLPNAISWVQVHLTNIDGTDAAEGLYYIRFGSDWFPLEAILDAGISEIPLQRLNADQQVVRFRFQEATVSVLLTSQYFRTGKCDQLSRPSKPAVDIAVSSTTCALTTKDTVEDPQILPTFPTCAFNRT